MSSAPVCMSACLQVCTNVIVCVCHSLLLLNIYLYVSLCVSLNVCPLNCLYSSFYICSGELSNIRCSSADVNAVLRDDDQASFVRYAERHHHIYPAIHTHLFRPGRCPIYIQGTSVQLTTTHPQVCNTSSIVVLDMMLRSNHLVQTVRTTLKWEKSQFSRM